MLCLCRWMGAAASTVGRGHIKRGMPCQDAADISLDSDAATIVISDGAGSAQHSEHGATIAVKTTTQILQKTVPWTDPEFVKEQILDACRLEMIKRANTLGCPIVELSTTLAFVAVTEDVCIVGNLGDGIVATLRDEKSEILIGQERGEFANETVFLTSSRANKHLRVIRKPLDVHDGFAIMSDGAAESLYQRQEGKLAPALTRIFSWFKERSSAEIEDDFHGEVMPLIVKYTQDDCSLAVLRRVRVSMDSMSEKTTPFMMEFLGNHRKDGFRNRVEILECYQKGITRTNEISEVTNLSENTIRKHKRIIKSLLVQSCNTETVH